MDRPYRLVLWQSMVGFIAALVFSWPTGVLFRWIFSFWPPFWAAFCIGSFWAFVGIVVGTEIYEQHERKRRARETLER